MALNIPMPGQPGEALMKGLSTGSNLLHNMMLNKYYGQLHPSGDVANAMYVEELANKYGREDPRYLQAKAAHDMAMQGHQSLMDYRTQLSGLAPYRAATPEEKLVAAQQGKGVLQTFGGGNGFGSGSGEQKASAGMVSGDDGHVISEEEAKVYNQALGKKTTDAAIRNKIPYAKNVKITMNNINPESLVQYSGPEGSLKYGVDFAKSLAGKPPPEFLEYQTAVTGAKTLSKQLRQFWGDSIQPSATDKIDQLTNPSTWNKNPQVALQQFNQLKQITDQELQTFEEGGTSPFKLDYDKKTGSFITLPKNKAAVEQLEIEAPANNENQIANEANPEDFLNQMRPKLLQINPNYTIENIKHTAKETGKSVEAVIQELFDKANQGGQ